MIHNSGPLIQCIRIRYEAWLHACNVETLHKSKVWIPEHAEQTPYRPSIWVVKQDIWEKNGGR